jgi:hypothetical protein
MTLSIIITIDERMAAPRSIKGCIADKSGIGKTSLLWTLDLQNYHKLGGKIVYALGDIEAYQRRHRAETHSSILGSWE